ncbi:uncharacterized protein METZ01_LOCUS216679, partial [marine metagenome]
MHRMVLEPVAPSIIFGPGKAWRRVLLSQRQHLRSPDVPVYAGVVPSGDPPQEARED